MSEYISDAELYEDEIGEIDSNVFLGGISSLPIRLDVHSMAFGSITDSVHCW